MSERDDVFAGLQARSRFKPGDLVLVNVGCSLRSVDNTIMIGSLRRDEMCVVITVDTFDVTLFCLDKIGRVYKHLVRSVDDVNAFKWLKT